jgi:hypothetical protein
MVYKVPQFIEVEDKIFGPFTFKQFIYLGGGVGSVFVFRAFFPWIIAIPLSIPFIGLGVALAFFRMNDQPFIRVLEAAFYYYVIKNRLYLWKKEVQKQIENVPSDERTQNQLLVPKIGENRLKDLAWSLDIREKMGGGVDANSESQP